jgi:glycosyltransferase involved in cell wall biosynthesis
LPATLWLQIEFDAVRVLHVLPSINPAQGGPVEAVRSFTGAMVQDGVSAEVLTLEAPRPAWTSGWSVPIHSLGSTRTYYLFTPHLGPWLDRNHRAYSAVIVHGIWRYSSAGTWYTLRNLATPYFLFTHGMMDPWFRGAYPCKHLKKLFFWRLIEHRVLRDARAVLFTSEQERQQANRSFRPYECQENVVGYGTADPPNDSRHRAEFIKQFPRLAGKRLALFLGRLHRVKGCDLLIKGFARVAFQDPRLHLVVAGPDEEGLKPSLSQLASGLGVAERIHWIGQLRGASKWGALRSAEVFVLPSHTENYSVATVEALACGVPVLLSERVNTWREIIEDGAGLVAPDDEAGTAKLFIRWQSLTSEDKRIMRLNARRCYLRRFQLDRFVENFIRTLRDSVNHPNSESVQQEVCV